MTNSSGLLRPNPRDGGYAFPNHHKSAHDAATGVITHSGAPGVSVLDYFAAKWLQGAAADPTVTWEAAAIPLHVGKAYDVAEAMVLERQRRRGV